MILLSIGSQLFGQSLLVFAMGHLSPVVTGLGLLTQPIAAAAIGWMVYGEQLSAVDALGALLIWFLWIKVELWGPQLMALLTAPLPAGALKSHLLDSASHMRFIAMGLVLLLVLRFAPRGLVPER